MIFFFEVWLYLVSSAGVLARRLDAGLDWISADLNYIITKLAFLIPLLFSPRKNKNKMLIVILVPTSITKAHLYNSDLPKYPIYIAKLGFTGDNLIYGLWVFDRAA